MSASAYSVEAYYLHPSRGGGSLQLGRKRERGQEMSKIKRHTIIKDTHTGEILAVADLSEARARAIVKAYLKAGLFVEAVA